MKAKLYWGEIERTVKNIIMIMTTGIVVSVLLSGCVTTSQSGYSPLSKSEYQSSLQDKSDLWLQNRLVEIDTDIAQLGVHFPETRTYSVTPSYGYAGGYTVSPQNDKYSGALEGFKQGRTSRLLGEKSLILQELNRRRFLK